MEQNNKIGENLYTALKKNNARVYSVSIVCLLVSLGSLVFSFLVYKNSLDMIYGVNPKNGDMMPLSRIEGKEGEAIQLKANITYFVDNYYSLNAFNMKSKREKVFWLVGEKPTIIIKDRANKGYFDNFLTVAGLQQNAQILEQTLKISDSEPTQASFTVRITRTNNGVSEYYNNYITMTLVKVNRNYPYNPYGYLITQFSENLQRVADVTTDEDKALLQGSEDAINQNPKEVEPQTQQSNPTKNEN